MKSRTAMVAFDRDGRNRVLQTQQWLAAPLERVFTFYSDAIHLESITPEWLHFHVLTPHSIRIQQGSLIDYRLRLRGIPIRWQSEISEWEPPFRFVDRQVRGPYRLWSHEHLFTEYDGGTLVSDRVDYRVPGGTFVDWLFVRTDLRRIFEYRHRKLGEVFGSEGALPAVLSR